MISHSFFLKVGPGIFHVFTSKPLNASIHINLRFLLEQNEAFFEGPGYFEINWQGLCHNSKKIGHWAVKEADKIREDVPATGIIAATLLPLRKGLTFFDLKQNSWTSDNFDAQG